MCLYKTITFPHQPLKSISKVTLVVGKGNKIYIVGKGRIYTSSAGQGLKSIFVLCSKSFSAQHELFKGKKASLYFRKIIFLIDKITVLELQQNAFLWSCYVNLDDPRKNFQYKWQFCTRLLLYLCKVFRHLYFLQYLSENLNNNNLKGCLWKQGIHKRTEIGELFLLSLFIYSYVVCKAVYAPMCRSCKGDLSVTYRYAKLYLFCAPYHFSLSYWRY